MESNNQFRAIDFFCDGGGMTCAKETNEYNNPQSTFIQADIKRLRSNFFERKIAIKRYKFN